VTVSNQVPAVGSGTGPRRRPVDTTRAPRHQGRPQASDLVLEEPTTGEWPGLCVKSLVQRGTVAMSSPSFSHLLRGVLIALLLVLMLLQLSTLGPMLGERPDRISIREITLIAQ
jgi:hypothetical protein